LAAGIVAIRAGQAERIVQTVLFRTVPASRSRVEHHGFRLNAIFSDTELRRYPLGALDRRLARHLIGIVDPFWFFFLALNSASLWGYPSWSWQLLARGHRRVAPVRLAIIFARTS